MFRIVFITWLCFYLSFFILCRLFLFFLISKLILLRKCNLSTPRTSSFYYSLVAWFYSAALIRRLRRCRCWSIARLLIIRIVLTRHASGRSIICAWRSIISRYFNFRWLRCLLAFLASPEILRLLVWWVLSLTIVRSVLSIWRINFILRALTKTARTAISCFWWRSIRRNSTS